MSKQLKELLKLSKEHIDKKEYLEALGYIQQVVNYEEHNYVALMFAGFCHEKLGQAKEAEEMYTRAVQVDPKNVQAWLGFAELYEKHEAMLVDVKAKKVNVYEKIMNLDKAYDFLLLIVWTRKWTSVAEKLVWVLDDAEKVRDYKFFLLLATLYFGKIGNQQIVSIANLVCQHLVASGRNRNGEKSTSKDEW